MDLKNIHKKFNNDFLWFYSYWRNELTQSNSVKVIFETDITIEIDNSVIETYFNN